MTDDNTEKMLNPIIQIPMIYCTIFSGYHSAKMKYRTNQDLIGNLLYEMENVKGVDYTKTKMPFNRDQYIEKYYKLSDTIEGYETENKILKDYTEKIEGIFESISDPSLKEAIRKRYRFE
ncbi:MAG: hypothetical protein IKS54_06385 [Erysipelotrichaceae bacterium]|nr:hypothetical protein [Erysipelotrichaceae bacterium]